MSVNTDLVAKAFDRNGLWIKLVSVATGLYGLGLSLTLIGAVVGIPMIYCAVILWQSVDLARRGEAESALNKTMFFFKLLGILTLARLALSILWGFMGIGMVLIH